MSMFRPLRRRAASLLLGLCCGLLAPSVGAQSAADVDAARELFKQGSQAGKKGKWGDARDKYRRSLELKAAPITHFSLAVAEKHTGDYVSALENFRAFLVSPPNEATDGYREPAQAAVDELETLVGRVAISIEPRYAAELAVTVDGVTVPEAALGTPRIVNPGKHVVKATAKGYRSVSEPFDVASGGQAEVALKLEPAPPGEVSPRPSTTPIEVGGDTAESSFPVGPVLLMSGGALTVGAGLTVGLLGLSKAKDAPSEDSPEADTARTMGLAGDIVAGAGGAIVVAGFIWLLVPSDVDEDGVATRLEPWSDGDVAGVRLRF